MKKIADKLMMKIRILMLTIHIMNKLVLKKKKCLQS